MLHEKLLNQLKLLKEHGPSNKSQGICNSIQHGYHTKELLEGVFPYWSKYSGETKWPVPSDNPYYGPYTRLYYHDKWDRSTQYGRDRWELLDFLIEFLEDLELLHEYGQVMSIVEIPETEVVRGLKQAFFYQDKHTKIVETLVLTELYSLV